MVLDRLLLWTLPLLIAWGFAARFAWYEPPPQMRHIWEMRSVDDNEHYWVVSGEHFTPSTRFGIYPHGQARAVPEGYSSMDLLDRDRGQGVRLLSWRFETSGIAVLPIPDDLPPGAYDLGLYDLGERLQVGSSWARNTPSPTP